MINKIGTNSYNRIKAKIALNGYNVNPLVFIYMRLFSSLILFIVLLFLVNYGYIIAPVITVLYYIFIEMVVLDFGLKNRVEEIENDALEFMPIFLLSLKNGRNIKKSLKYTTEIVDNTLSSEFAKVLYDEKVGNSLDEALIKMKSRIPSDLVINMIVSIIEANRLGNSISDSINTQLSYIDNKRKTRIISSYKIVPLKMAFISVVFVFVVTILLLLCVL
ncbi:MAG: type II secretion system F family protein [Candidatus Coprovivens sp.]